MAKRKKKTKASKVLLLILLVLGLGVIFFFQTRPKLQVVSVVSRIDGYDYYIESNATKIYKKYYEQLSEEIKDNKIDEEEYAKLISKLFSIDYYTLNNKITNKDIGGVQFIHSDLKESFIEESSKTVYKYVKENLYGTRKQKLPEVEDVDIVSIENIKYKNGSYKDNDGYKVKVNIKYSKAVGYPDTLELYLIHEDNKLVIVEIK